MRPALEVADIFRRHGAAFRRPAGSTLARRSAASWPPSRPAAPRRSAAMSSTATTAAWTRIAYNSCRNRHCPKCQGLARARWLEPTQGRAVAGPVSPCRLHAAGGHRRHRTAEQGKSSTTSSRAAAAETLLAIAADPKHLGAEIGFFVDPPHLGPESAPSSRMSTASSPAADFSLDRKRWNACRTRLLPASVRVLSRLFRRLFLDCAASTTANSRFHGQLAHLNDQRPCRKYLAATRKHDWVVYAKPPSAARSRSSIISDATPTGSPSPTPAARARERSSPLPLEGLRQDGKSQVMTLEADEFIRRFLLHVLPRLPAHPPLRLPRQRLPQRQPRRCRRLLDARTRMRCEPADNRTQRRSPAHWQPTSPSVPIAAAPCGGSQPCRAPATRSHSPVTRHDRPTDPTVIVLGPSAADSNARIGTALPINLSTGILPTRSSPGD